MVRQVGHIPPSGDKKRDPGKRSRHDASFKKRKVIGSHEDSKPKSQQSSFELTPEDSKTFLDWTVEWILSPLASLWNRLLGTSPSPTQHKARTPTHDKKRKKLSKRYPKRRNKID